VAAAGGEKKTFLAELLPFFRAIISATERDILKGTRAKGVLIIHHRHVAIEACFSYNSVWLSYRPKLKQNQANNYLRFSIL
jgi:hypothetical protein